MSHVFGPKIPKVKKNLNKNSPKKISKDKKNKRVTFLDRTMKKYKQNQRKNLNKIEERNMNKIKERNTFSIEVNPDESSPPHWDHANSSILDSSDMERQQGELHLQRPSVTGGGYCTKKCFFLTFFHRTTFFVSDFIITTC